MILYINTFITEEKFSTQGAYIRQNAKYSNKLDVFKYMLSSLSNFYPWAKVIINVKLDQSYESEKTNLHNYIQNLFDKYPLVINDKRNSRKAEWIADYDLFDDDLIMYIGNHDHIFIDPDPSYFASIIEKFRNVDDYIGIQFSHWPELCVGLWKHIQAASDTTLEHDHFHFRQKQCHAIQVINRKTYKMWWFDENIPDIDFPRSDGIGGPALDSYDHFQPMKIVGLYREVCRHFDGYQHTIWEYLPNETVPVLEIPDGFFENNIQINYSTKYIPGLTNINPIDDRLKIFNEQGFELNLPKQVLPKFWKDKINYVHDDFENLKFVWSNEEIKNIYIKRLQKIWDYSLGYRSHNGQILKQKIEEYYGKLF